MAKSELKQSDKKLPAFALVARYSGKYLPAWRIIQIGGVVSVSPASARSIGLAFSMIDRFQLNEYMSSLLLLKAASYRSKRKA